MPPPLALDELAAQIIKLTAGLNAATYKWLGLVAEYDNRCTWPNGELQSCAQWLQRNCGFKLNAARERLRVAHALRDLPKISAAMARGARNVRAPWTESDDHGVLSLDLLDVAKGFNRRAAHVAVGDPSAAARAAMTQLGVAP